MQGGCCKHLNFGFSSKIHKNLRNYIFSTKMCEPELQYNGGQNSILHHVQVDLCTCFFLFFGPIYLYYFTLMYIFCLNPLFYWSYQPNQILIFVFKKCKRIQLISKRSNGIWWSIDHSNCFPWPRVVLAQW